MWGVEWLVIAAMVLLNAVFAAYEIALASVSLARLRVLVGEERTGARAALWMKENMEASLAAVQLGITLVGATAAATGGAGAEEMIAPLFERLGMSAGWADVIAIATVVVPLSAVTILVGELFPKVFALRNKEWVCLRLSIEMRWVSYAVWPAVWLFESIVTGIMSWGESRWQAKLDGGTRSEAAELQELRAIAALARTSRLIGGAEEQIIVQAARLSTRAVREIILPTEHIATLNVNDTMADSLVAAHMDMHTRFPVCERPGDKQSIIGYVNFKDIVAELKLSPREPSLRGILRSIPSLPEHTPIATCLERMIREHTHIALVSDAAQHIIGMITLEDILEELVGDIQDEYDRLPSHVIASGPSWVVGGGITLSRLKELAAADLESDAPPGNAVNLSDWVAGHLGREVRGGDVIERKNLRVVVRKIRRQKLLEAQVTVLKPGHPGTPPPLKNSS